ncbi:hypothetical protein O181_039562 [Austropuccinia psidii MF-1]|uniref:FAD-binding FR-type domain-containing protein n=1 Tax=Austropuccinia psidii MF-1 TaxID=1389203 RepID=A0A9Q3DH19_9BASI|nr:hypothetical protein [Austropuccinia psidii MF-1]
MRYDNSSSSSSTMSLWNPKSSRHPPSNSLDGPFPVVQWEFQVFSEFRQWPSGLGSFQANPLMSHNLLSMSHLHKSTHPNPSLKTHPKLQSQQQTTTQDGLIFFLTGMLVLFVFFFLLNLPFLLSHCAAGAFRQGWRLKRFNQNEKPRAIPNSTRKGNRFSLKDSNRLGVKRIYINFNYWYNKLILTAMWRCRNLTVGRLSLIILYNLLVIISLSIQTSRKLDLLKSFRKFGYISMAQITILFIISMKNNICSVSGLDYNQLKFLHRIIGQAVLFCSSTHVFLILHAQVLPFRQLLHQPTYIYGALAFGSLLAITLTSCGPIKRMFYQVFLVSHIIGYSLLLFGLWKHVKSTHPWIYACVTCTLLDGLLRLFNTRSKTARFTSLPGKVTVVEVDGIGTGWRAGQHVFLRVCTPSYIFEKHPFMITNAPASESPHRPSNTLVLVSKGCGDYTRKLHQIGLTRAAIGQHGQTKIETKKFSYIPDQQSMDDSPLVQLEDDNKLSVCIEGPYGNLYGDMRMYETVILAASGIAFTFVMSLFEEIVGSSLRGLSATKKLIIVWALRDIDVIEAFMCPMEQILHVARGLNLIVTIRLHVTSQTGTYLPTPFPELSVIPKRVNLHALITEAVAATWTGVDFMNRSEPCRGLGIAASSRCSSFIRDLKTAALSIDKKTFREIGGVRVHVENFGDE